MSALEPLEKSLSDLFVKQAPALPANGKKALVQYLPWINLVAGVVSVLAAYGLYHTAHYVNRAADLVNSLSAAYGGQPVVSYHVSLITWLAIAVLAVSGVLYLMAYMPTKERKANGWDLMFYALLVNLAYGVLAAFTDYGGIGRLFGSIVSFAIGGWLLFQIKSLYLKK